MSDQEFDEQPTIRFAGVWIPAHEVWSRMESATVVVEHIHRFNEQFPHLASEETRRVVPVVRQRLKEIELRMPSKDEPVDDVSDVAARLLETLTVEETLTALAEEHGVPLGVQQLIQIAGEEPYTSALRREGSDLKTNRVSPEQTAQLWNEQGRPAPGGGLWSPTKVIKLLGDA
jgi:hypothetical protein